MILLCIIEDLTSRSRSPRIRWIVRVHLHRAKTIFYLCHRTVCVVHFIPSERIEIDVIFAFNWCEQPLRTCSQSDNGRKIDVASKGLR